MWRIPLSDLTYDDAEQQAVLEVLRSRWLSMGPRTEEFEARAAKYLGVRHAIAVANGTCALEMAYRQLIGHTVHSAVKPWVVVPDLTFVATANAALSAGADVRLADISSSDTPMLDLGEASAIMDRAAAAGARCILAPVHYAGFDAGCQAFVEAARQQGALVVEDAAHAIGGVTAAGRALGTCGDIGCFSFFANKNLATGEGGLVVTDDEETATELRLLRSHGMTSLTWERHSSRGHGYDVLRPGHNYRITELTAALGLVQLGKLDEANRRRRHLYRLYRDSFRGEPALLVPFGEDDGAIDRSACHIFPLLFSDTEMRDMARVRLNEAGIQTSHHYPPVHSFTFYQEYLDKQRDARDPGSLTEQSLHGTPADHEQSRHRYSFSRTSGYSACQMTLPLHPGLKEVEVEEVTSMILQTVHKFRAARTVRPDSSAPRPASL